VLFVIQNETILISSYDTFYAMGLVYFVVTSMSQTSVIINRDSCENCPRKHPAFLLCALLQEATLISPCMGEAKIKKVDIGQF